MQLVQAVNNIPLAWRTCINSINLEKIGDYYEGNILISIHYDDGGLPHSINGYEIGVSLADQADLFVRGVTVLGSSHIPNYRFTCTAPEGQFTELQKLLGKLTIYKGEGSGRVYYQIGTSMHDSLTYGADITRHQFYGKGKPIITTKIMDIAEILLLRDTLTNYLREHKNG